MKINVPICIYVCHVCYKFFMARLIRIFLSRSEFTSMVKNAENDILVVYSKIKLIDMISSWDTCCNFNFSWWYNFKIKYLVLAASKLMQLHEKVVHITDSLTVDTLYTTLCMYVLVLCSLYQSSWRVYCVLGFNFSLKMHVTIVCWLFNVYVGWRSLANSACLFMLCHCSTALVELE